MQISVNGEQIRIFSGARVEDALRRYSMEEYKKVKAGEKIVRDKYGNRVKLGGELTGREEFTIAEA